MSSSTSEPDKSFRKPIQNFRIRWNRATQVFGAIKRAWTEEERSPDDNAKPLVLWRYQLPDGGYLNFGRKFHDLFFSKLDIGDDHEWHYDHALGQGGFGAVALFNKIGTDTATLKDQVVIKTAKATQRFAVDTDRVDLSQEAAMMGQTNDLEEDGMLVLRQFKYYHADDKQWRYYLEYCPYGDLERLRVRYKAYGRYLPELFLWHLFTWLATTVHEYSEYNDWRHTDTEHWGETMTDGFLLHSDIKPQNIVLGEPDPEATLPLDLYPTPRIADLGLAEVQSPRKKDNTASSLDKGTPNWFPPEIRWRRLHPRNDFNPFRMKLDPNVEAPRRKGLHRVTSKANVWAIGAVMFSMTTLHESDVLSDMVDHILDQHMPVPPEGESVIDDADFKIIKPQYYSMELRDLIKDCVRLHWNDRPSEQEVMDRATDAYGKHLQVLRNLGHSKVFHDCVESHRDYKVYYRKNEIDAAPDNYRFNHPGCTRRWYEQNIVNQFPWIPPSWGRLWPRNMPMDVAVPQHWSKRMRDALLQRAVHAQLGTLSIAEPTVSAALRRNTELHARLSVGGSQQEPQVPSEHDGDVEENDSQEQTPVPQVMLDAPTPRAGFSDDDEDDEEDTEHFEPGPVRTDRLWTDRYAPYNRPSMDSQNYRRR